MILKTQNPQGKQITFILAVLLNLACISDLERAYQSPVKNKNICDNFGNVDSKTIPSESIYFDEKLQKEAIITDRFLKTVPLDYLTNAVNIQNKHDLIAFQKLYSDACGNTGKPAIFDKIEFVIKEKQKLAQDILKNINPENVVEVKVPKEGEGFSSFGGMIKNILRKLGQEDSSYGPSTYPNEYLKNFVESHFNDIEYKLYNSLKYDGDEFIFKDSVEELHEIKKEKKYLYIQIYTRNLAKLFDVWKEYDFKTQTFSTKFSEEWEKNDRFDMPKDLQIKIPLKEAKYFKDLYIGHVDDGIGDKRQRPIEVELLFKIENGFEDKIAWGDCSDNMIYWTKPPIETTCKVRMDLRRKKLNLIPVRYRIENSSFRDLEIYLNY
ncbi:hypothetical protein LEP1GSC060_3457 [Leptospira weilii serovar Ranarum str. ICFT]|uniref:Uncharacterized protein n=1 Tax=Leptospira weilii serovar Ranarum str. ICFT TaxID=1218598 RepID=N1WHY8_9LEPT|nr:hypothetical protein [Leptospira weilii]EMY76749.1 hypothetical protein LEP1GSC060_3457 [Leptospira weilii serovar Ranarum str. ICFT]